MKKMFMYGAGILPFAEFKISEVCTIRPVALQSEIDFLRTVYSSQREYGFLCSLAESISFEIETTGQNAREAAINLWNHQWIILLLSVYSSKAVFWPFQSDQSAASKNISKIHLSNIFISTRIFGEPHFLNQNDLIACKSVAPNFMKLISEPSFSYAASVALTNFQEPKDSIRVAAIWAGIEALLGFDQELKFRIALSISRLLEKDMVKRKKRFSEVKKLYDLRSKCVHGALNNQKSVAKEADASLDLLNELILFFAQRGSTFSEEEKQTIFLD